MSKWFSRKLLIAVLGFITVNVLPNLSSDTRAKYSAVIASIYTIAQGIADGFGSAKSGASQGDPVAP